MRGIYLDLFPGAHRLYSAPGDDPFAAFAACGEGRGTGMTGVRAAAEDMPGTREPADSWPG